MPTYERTDRFDRDWQSLTEAQRKRFRAVARRFVSDLRTGRFRAGLRVRGIAGVDRIFEMTWAPDGRATFEYGRDRGDSPHVIWRRIGTHDIFGQPSPTDPPEGLCGKIRGVDDLLTGPVGIPTLLV